MFSDYTQKVLGGCLIKLLEDEHIDPFQFLAIVDPLMEVFPKGSIFHERMISIVKAMLEQCVKVEKEKEQENAKDIQDDRPERRESWNMSFAKE